jgi:hypothetical protein
MVPLQDTVCDKALVAACPTGGKCESASGVMKCDECIGRRHQALVRVAGCIAGEVQDWCRHEGPATSAGGADGATTLHYQPAVLVFCATTRPAVSVLVESDHDGDSAADKGPLLQGSKVATHSRAH